MSESMLDAGHHWWLRCDDHDIAWYNGGVDEPTEEDWDRNPCPMCVLEASMGSRIAALEAELAQARKSALEKAASHIESGGLSSMGRRTESAHNRALKPKPAMEPEPGVSDYCPEARKKCAVCGSEGEHKMSCRPVNRELASEANGLLPKKRRREHEYGEEKQGNFGHRVSHCTRPECQAYRIRSRSGASVSFRQSRESPSTDEPGPCEVEP